MLNLIVSSLIEKERSAFYRGSSQRSSGVGVEQVQFINEWTGADESHQSRVCIGACIFLKKRGSSVKQMLGYENNNNHSQ